MENTSTMDTAAQVVDIVRQANPGAEAEVVVWAAEHALTRFANSFIHQNVAEAGTSVRLRLHAEGRTASGSTTLTDAAGLRALVERTLAAARLCPPDPQWPGLAPPAPVPDAAPVDEQTAAAEPDARAARVRAFVAAAAPLETAGYCSTTSWSMAFANSAGQSASARSAQAAMDAIARQGTADGVGRLVCARMADLDGGVLGARAAAKALASVQPEALEPGRYEVVLEPTAVVDLLQIMAFYGFNGKAITERRSFVEPGADQFDQSLSLVDDPLGPGGMPFDVEGTPKRPMRFIDAGGSAGVAHDRRSAALAGTTSTGHALPGGAAFGAVAMNLHLLPAPDGAPATETSGPAADSAVTSLVEHVGRGLLVSDFWYTRVLDPRTLVVTGLTRNGVWLIEDGAITRPVQNLRFTQSYPRALEPGAVLGIGSQVTALPLGWDVMAYRAAALHLSSWNFTGNASG